MQTVALNDGVAIPQIGFGTFQIPAGAETEKAVAFALTCGCRHIDTAAAYFNEADADGRHFKLCKFTCGHDVVLSIDT